MLKVVFSVGNDIFREEPPEGESRNGQITEEMIEATILHPEGNFRLVAQERRKIAGSTRYDSYMLEKETQQELTEVLSLEPSQGQQPPDEALSPGLSLLLFSPLSLREREVGMVA